MIKIITCWMRGSGHAGIFAALFFPLILVGDPSVHKLRTFNISSPPHASWRLMVQGGDSIWVHRARSPQQFLMMGIMSIEIVPERWSMEDQELAQAIIHDFHIESGSTLQDEMFEVKTIEGKRFFPNSALLQAFHSNPLQVNLTAHELVYVFIGERKVSERPALYLFAFTDVHDQEVIFEEDFQEFYSVLRSFKLREKEEPVG